MKHRQYAPLHSLIEPHTLDDDTVNEIYVLFSFIQQPRVMSNT